jgi:hypothetical protein
MKVWPPGKRHRPVLGGIRRSGAGRRHERARPSSVLADWVLHDEKLLVESRFGGDSERYAAWRDRLWAEMHDTMRRPERHPDPARGNSADEEYVVMTAFDGDWAQYRVCRDRLREELWQIMKVTRER